MMCAIMYGDFPKRDLAGIATIVRHACAGNFNETGDMFRPAEHFCKVAAINYEIVDEKQRQIIEAAK